MASAIDKGPILGMRHVQAVLVFLDINVTFIIRFNVSVAVVAMTNAKTTNPDFPEFDWTNKQIQYIISSFFCGYLFTQLPGGMLSKRFGSKIVMFTSTFFSALLSVLIPWGVTAGGWQAYCVIRILQGLTEGPLFPCIHQHLARWVPLEERVNLGALSQSGIECGMVLAMAISGLVANSPLGWPGIFYVSAGASFIWCILWWIFASNNPTESRFITEVERKYIETSLKHAEDYHKTKIPVPWKAIFSSMPFLALLTVRCAGGYGLATLRAQIPSYMHGVLQKDIKDNALYSSLPFMAMWAMAYVFLGAAVIIQHYHLLSLTGLRKTINSTAYGFAAAGLVAIGFLDKDDEKWAIALMIMLTAVQSGVTIGSMLNTIDLSPNHAGILMAITNTALSFTAFFSPLVVGAIVTDTSCRSQWQIVFLIAAAVFFFGNLFYVIFGSAVTQPWDAVDYLVPKGAGSSTNRN